VLHGGKAGEGSAADTLAGRVGGPEFGVGVFEVDQFAVKPVILRVGDDGLREDVIGVVMSLKGGDEFGVA